MGDDKIINGALARLSALTGEDFHGYRSEVWGVIAKAIREARRTPPPATALQWSSEPPKAVGFITKGTTLTLYADRDGWEHAVYNSGGQYGMAGEVSRVVFKPIPEPTDPAPGTPPRQP